MVKEGPFTKFLRDKARPLLDELPVPSTFYDDLWYQLLTKHPGLCSKIEDLRMDVPSMEEHALLQARVQMLETKLEATEEVVAELYERLTKGKPEQ